MILVFLAVLDSHATLTLTTTFSTVAAVSQSAYFFPLNPDVALYGLTVTITSNAATRIIHGKVSEKESAREAFATAVSEGRSAALLGVSSILQNLSKSNILFTFVLCNWWAQRSEACEEVYKLNLGALPADSTISVEVSFAQTLRAEAHAPGALRLVLPAALLHRYTPAPYRGRIGGSGADIAEAVGATVAALAGRGDAASGGPDHPSLRLRLGIAAAQSVPAVTSPSHAEYLHAVLGRAEVGGSCTPTLVEINVPKSQVWYFCLAW